MLDFFFLSQITQLKRPYLHRFTLKPLELIVKLQLFSHEMSAI